MEPVQRNMLLILSLLLSFSGVRTIQCSTVHENTTDMLTLLHFKHTIRDPSGALVSWNKTTPFCMWEGVTCSPKNPGRVAILDLHDQGLVGRITPSLGNLTFMKLLNLSSNRFFGSVPHLNYTQELLALDLSKNSLEGEIPTSLANLSSLEEIDLSSNNLEGPIPLEIGSLYNLLVLDLSRNNLTGAIPNAFKNTTHLVILALQTNSLEGAIPAELGTLSNLSQLILAENRLSGAVPPAIFHLPLQILDLGSNILDNELPPNMGDTLPNLQTLLLGDNKFKGHIPASLGHASRLMTIDLQQNHLTGQIPSSFGKLSGLLFLILGNNKLEARDNVGWEFLYALKNCSFLRVLSIEENRLQGTIPNSVGDLKSLQQLFFNGNNLSGTVPSSIGNLNNLILLNLSSNHLTGTIGDWVGKLKRLQVLHLEENNFIEQLPDSFVNLTRLLSLHLAKNEFEGLIPPSLGSLSHLLELDLSFNNLNGNIPKEVFSATTLTMFILSSNNLEGSIPLEIGKLTQLIELDISSNKLTGEIPASLGGCQALQIIQMDNNNLTGGILTSFGNLSDMHVLNLSHNSLSGTIPKALGDLGLLTNLDLSYNHLQGEVPTNGVFEKPTSISLEGNWGLCGGSVDLRFPSCHRVSRGAERQYYLIKILIPIFGFLSLVLLIYFIFLERKMPNRTRMLIPSFLKQFPKVTYNDLAQATEEFSESNLIGRGSYGSVYRGKLKDPKMEVAVKVFDLEMHGAEKSFMSECEALRGIQHRNLVPIETACSTVDHNGNPFKALIYELMPNGNLDTWLHPNSEGKAPKHLGLTQRINIAVNIADALDYLHNDCRNPIIHCDLKPSNVLLDNDMNARLGDFGIARFYHEYGISKLGTSSIGVKGTIGYIPPEYATGSHVSTSGDVYSFGIVLLEMLTGKRPTDTLFNDGLDIVNFARSNFPQQIFRIIDAHVMEECKDLPGQDNIVAENAVFQCLVSLVQISLSCTLASPSERMSMREVASKMHAIQTSHAGLIAKNKK